MGYRRVTIIAKVKQVEGKLVIEIPDRIVKAWALKPNDDMYVRLVPIDYPFNVTTP